MNLSKITLKLFSLLILVSICSCSPKDEATRLIRGFTSGSADQYKASQSKLIVLAKNDPESVRRAINLQVNALVWARVIYIAGEADPKLLSELLQDVTKLAVPLGTAICHVELPALKKLSSEERQSIRQIYDARLASIMVAEQKEMVEKFLQLLTDADAPK